MKARFGEWSGWHVAVLMFAAWLVSVPAGTFLQSLLPAGSTGRELLGRMLPYLAAGIGIVGIAALRRQVRQQVAAPMPPGVSREIGVALSLDLLGGFAWMGGYVLWWHVLEGPVALEQRLAFGTHAEGLQKAFSLDGMLFGILLAVLLGPIIEEILFRGVLFRLWKEQYGWMASVVMTSTLFGLYHTNFAPAFMSSLLLTSLYSRTASLKAVILAHAAHNLIVYYPLLGQFIARRDLVAPGDPRSWAFHVMALSICMVAIPLYVWFAGVQARGRHEGDSDVALSR